MAGARWSVGWSLGQGVLERGGPPYERAMGGRETCLVSHGNDSARMAVSETCGGGYVVRKRQRLKSDAEAAPVLASRRRGKRNRTTCYSARAGIEEPEHRLMGKAE